MIKEILTYPNNKDILTQKSEIVENIDDCILAVIQDMKDTLHNTKEGVGISAIQIGVAKRICVIHYNNEDLVLINPKITRKRGEITSYEGCLSVPDKYGFFKRAQKVWCEYTDENGRKKELSDGGFISRVIQHELDHLDGWCVVFDLVKELNVNE